MKQTVVLYPAGTAVGHVRPMTQLARAFVERGFDVTMVLIAPPVDSTDSNTTVIESIITAACACDPSSVSVHVLPRLPPPADFASSTRHPWLLMLEYMRQHDAALETFLRSILPRERLHSLVVDMFCAHAVDVALKLDIPVYTFFASGAGVLAVLAQLPTLLAGRTTGLKELGDAPLELLGVPAMPASYLIRELLGHPDEEPCRTMMRVWRRSMGTRGVLVNTFEALESHAVQAFGDTLCGLSKMVPPIYCIGPLVDDDTKQKQVSMSRHECLEWLDAQPDRSVVLLCWGSKGLLSEDQLTEIAVGLEKSGQRFLWAVRAPPAAASTADDDPKRYLERQRPEPDLDAFLPHGFLERTRGRGLVLNSWLPQVDALHHPAVGAFVTHCGWNSTLESVVAGVPMLCWPLDAEQKMNKVLMTGQDMGVAVEMAGYNAGFIKAEEVETKVRLMIESEEGEEIRKRVVELSNETEKALQDGGSSHAAFARFLEDVENLVAK